MSANRQIKLKGMKPTLSAQFDEPGNSLSAGMFPASLCLVIPEKLTHTAEESAYRERRKFCRIVTETDIIAMLRKRELP